MESTCPSRHEFFFLFEPNVLIVAAFLPQINDRSIDRAPGGYSRNGKHVLMLSLFSLHNYTHLVQTIH
jgi:hypothetical protein